MAIDIAKFKKTKVYETEARASEVKADLAALRALDAAAEHGRWTSCCGCLLTPVAAFVVLVGVGSQSNPGPVSAGVVAAALLCAIVCVIVFGWKFATAGKLNLEDRRYELVDRLLDLLGTDLGAAATVSLRLDLRPTVVEAKCTHSGDVGIWKVKYYADPWLDLRGRFLDGTAFRVAALQRYQARVKHYRSVSGKYKTKRKAKSAHQFSVQLRPKAKRYQHLDVLGKDAQGAVQLPAFAALKGVSVSEEGVALKAATQTEWTAPKPHGPEKETSGVQLVAMMFLSLYQILNLSRRVTRDGA